MSQLGGDNVEHLARHLLPGSLKRKREAQAHSLSLPSPSEGAKSVGVPNGASPPVSHSGNPPVANGNSAKHHRSPDSDTAPHSEQSDFMRGIGSASSLTSTASSLPSQASQAFAHNSKASLANGSTPLTNYTEASSSPKPTTRHTSNITADMASVSNGLPESRAPFSHATNNSTRTPRARPQTLPPPGKAKGYRVVWDPELDGKLSKEERKRAAARKREFGTEVYEPDPPPDPRLAIPGYMSGQCRGKERPSKAIMRLAPYNLPPWKIDKHSIGPGEAQQVAVLGFDPFLPESTLRLNFETFGSVASVQNQTDPSTGSFLGIALIKYRDNPRDGPENTAVMAAKRAEAEFNGQRIGLRTVRVELDREGRRCKRFVEQALKRAHEAMAKELKAKYPPPPASAGTPRVLSEPSAPPLNAPKGPSAKNVPKIPDGPKAAASPLNPRPTAALLLEELPVLSQIKRKPYIHVPHHSVPVLGSTIPHLKKRLKAYDWREVRLDRTGYYIVFENSKRGEDETERCFAECNKAALFTYTMEMECQKFGNPNYERSPSPERAVAEKQKKEHFERLKREELEDLEIEKKNRAENLDPVLGALEHLRAELRDRVMSDIKTRIAIPIFHDGLDPSKHAARRKKLGLSDPLDNENNSSRLFFSKANEASSRSRFGQAGSHSRPLRPHDPNSQRARKLERDRGPANAYLDERRRRPAPKPSKARGLHFRLQQMYEEEDDSDDERQTSMTRDTEDQESRPLSRNSTPQEAESTPGTPKHKRRKVEDWDEEEKETFTTLHKDLLGHLLQKEPEDLATRELELVIGTLPRSSRYATRARTELYVRQRSKADDDLFQVKGELKDFLDEATDGKSSATKEHDDTPSRDNEVKPAKQKSKKRSTARSKKQILEEKEVLKAEAKKAKASNKPVGPDTVVEMAQRAHELQSVEETLPHDIHRSFTFDKPRRTVEPETDIALDVDGWQHIVKDDEDLAYLKKALAAEASWELGGAKLWAWKQKEIKVLNTGERGPVSAEVGIVGYYVPNPTGSARTEGVKKILNEEKSKYLPHRIKVQQAREERQAQAKANPTAAAEAAKIAAAEKSASTAASRSNRVNNRRLVNDINLQKQTLATGSGSEIDVAIRFNQLKKRKKLVKFDRSAIHGWGLYAEENIAINDLIIEYVGEKVRQKIADLRELKYEKQGVGSSYLFRMMDDEIVDATKKGGIARFINHSCSPNCTAKIIKVEGTPRIVIYALKDIGKNDELTYDYKFEREMDATDRIPCLCGSANCKGFLN